MITVQINTPSAHNTQTFEQASLTSKLKDATTTLDNLIGSKEKRYVMKPSKSSVNLSTRDYERYFTLKGRETYWSSMKKLMPPLDVKIIVTCLVWYGVSAISSNITKEILKKFPHPTTLTEIQFLISSIVCCVTLFFINNNRQYIYIFPRGTLPVISKFQNSRTSFDLVKPTRKIIETTLPMGIFQFIGHITSHQATSVIPVSLVHSVKALSPLSTVLAYRFIFQVRYPVVTYVTLIPLMLGVILTCFSGRKSKNNTANGGFYKGLIFAFISMAIFVSQNIFAKKILTVSNEKVLPLSKSGSSSKKSDAEEQKIDKITILLYCSVFGFLLTLPIYFISELSNETFTLFEINSIVLSLFLLHGVTHFIQAMLAFHLIGAITPVNYSIANIMKRIVVISMAIVWERECVTGIQFLGLAFTMGGLYAYDRWGMTKK